MGTPTYEFYLEFAAHCFEHYPPDITINASTLVRAGFVGPRHGRGAPSLRSRFRRRGGIEWMLFRTLLRRARLRAKLAGDSATILGFVPFNRSDYEGLVRPYLDAITDSGVRCAVVVPGASAGRWVEFAARNGSSVTSIEAGASPAIYRDSRRTLATLRPALRDAADRFRISSRAQHGLAAFFAGFAFQKALASRLIEQLAPQVVVGLHFVSTRGWQAAIEGARFLGRKPRVVLVQHGAFEASSGFHDFEGADLVMLWGERWQRELQRFSSLPFRPVPHAVVTGNPKYDGVTCREDHRTERGTRVLYVSSHEGGRTMVSPLTITLQAFNSEPDFDIVVKPHPAERDGTLRALVERGELRAESVLAPRHPLRDCILGSDVVVGPSSTALYEAVWLGKPVVLLSEAPGPAFEGLMTATDAVALRSIVEQMVSNASWRAAVVARQLAVLEDVFGTTEGAVRAGAEMIGDLIRGNVVAT